ncbi:MAG: Gfo/Idh/MocA family oxidoreductase [Ruminococcaceae bacterium]|nr:Gfo/Idh/MocA family oxidoreductase [Oscillospiraceae bacterium]
MTRLGFGILGCGMIAGVHAAAIASLSDAVLIGAADASFERAADFAKAHGITAYETYAAMLADPAIDAVCICTPSGLHAENALDALAAGKHVVLEKPMALNVADADRVAAACKAFGRHLTVISQLRFSPDVHRAKQLVSEKAFGTLIFCDLFMKYHRDDAYYRDSPWRGTYRYDGGGALMNQGIHGIDLLRFIAGDYTAVSGITATRRHAIETEDTAAALIRFDCGAPGVIEATTAANPGFDRRIEILGDRGYMTLRENRIERLYIDGIADEHHHIDVPPMSGSPVIASHEMHALQIKNLIDTVMGRGTLLADASDGRAALKIIEDIYSFNH